jgi:hypothetical protein
MWAFTLPSAWKHTKPLVCAAPGAISATNQMQAASKVRADEHTDVPHPGRTARRNGYRAGRGHLHGSIEQGDVLPAAELPRRTRRHRF